MRPGPPASTTRRSIQLCTRDRPFPTGGIKREFKEIHHQLGANIWRRLHKEVPRRLKTLPGQISGYSKQDAPRDLLAEAVRAAIPASFRGPAPPLCDARSARWGSGAGGQDRDADHIFTSGCAFAEDTGPQRTIGEGRGMSAPASTMEDSVIDRVRWLSGGGKYASPSCTARSRLAFMSPVRW